MPFISYIVHLYGTRQHNYARKLISPHSLRTGCVGGIFAALSLQEIRMYTLLALVSTVLVCALRSVSCAHDLSEDYPFKATLNTAEKGGLYELYWTFDNAAETISFAVRVQTMGWVGFGISPNGQMPNSDVIMGWVDNGQTFLQVRMHARQSRLHELHRTSNTGSKHRYYHRVPQGTDLWIITSLRSSYIYG